MIWRLLKVSLTAMILLWLATKAFQLQSVETQKRLEQEQTVGPSQSEEEVVAPLETELPAEVQTTTTANRLELPRPNADLVFPVSGHYLESVISVFGDPRGNRLHQGIDIKADRGTVVVAAINGVIERVKEGGKGGKQVYLRGSEGRLFYYAHLDEFSVEEKEVVAAGQSLGTVGNTGNARHTSPHLHFEILIGEDRDAVDPMSFFLIAP